jgi:hypothetical protein
MVDTTKLIEREMREQSILAQARSGRIECCVCNARPDGEPPTPLWRLNSANARSGPLWACAADYRRVIGRPPASAVPDIVAVPR